MTTTSRRRRVCHRLVAAAVGLLALPLAGVSASAYWNGGGTGVGTASTGRLDPPTAVTASTAQGSSTVSVSWTNPVAGVTPTGYYVERTRTSSGATSPACGSSRTTLVHAPCTDTAVPDGTYTYAVTAVAGSWTATSAPSATVSVNSSVGTTTTLTSSANPSVVGQTVTYTATVTAGAGGTPSGQVVFKDGGQTVTCTGGTQQLDPSGVATCQVAYAAVGDHSMTAVYGGGPGFAASTSAVLTQHVGAGLAQTSTALASSANPAVTGQPVTYTATVTAGSGTPTGSVTFAAGGATITGCGTRPVNASGVATCATSFATTGARSVTATYSGDTAFAGSTSATLNQAVNKAATAISVTSSKNPQKSGQSVTFTAALSVASPGAGTPTGPITFKDGGSTISGCSAQTATAGQTTCTVTYGSMSLHQITAEYAGDANYQASTSTQLTQRVVNGGVTGILFTGVTVNGTAVAPSCGNSAGTTNATCTVPGGPNATAVANVMFVNSSGVATTYALDATTVSTAVVGKNATNPTLNIAGNTTTSSNTVSVQKNGNNSGTITATFDDGTSRFTVLLTIG